MGVTVCFEHVKGHHDNHQSISTLPCSTRLNILADQLAKKALLWLLQHCQHQVGCLVGDSWSLYIDNQAVSSDPPAPYHMAPWIPFGISVHGHSKIVHLARGLPSDQLPHPIQIPEIHLPLIPSMVFEVCVWTLYHRTYDVPVG